MAKIVNKMNEIPGKEETDRILKEQFGILQKMAEAKCSQFESELKSMFTSGEMGKCEIVGNRAIRYNSGQHVDIKAGCDAAIKDAIDMFFRGGDDVKQGFQKIIKASLDTIIGDTAMGEHYDKGIYIYPENFVIVRVDVRFYKYCFSSSGVIGNAENIFCYTMAKSIVDHTKVIIDELLYMVTEMLGTDKLDEVEAFVEQLKKVWGLLENKKPSEVLKAAIQSDEIM